MRSRRLTSFGFALLLAGCGSSPVEEQDGYPDAAIVPPDITSIPDATPMVLPRSKYGNPTDYEVAGERYFVLKSADGYRERGRASWYGTKFQGRRTSSGEPYDMFQMTAAHKTLPLPTYVRVTHLGNGKSVVVKVNDRGPFHQGRIIDLSYAAAARLDLLGVGHGEVEVEALDASTVTPPTAPPQFLQVGATDDPIYAIALREEAADLGIGQVEIRTIEKPESTYHRVLAGPFRDAASVEDAKKRLKAKGLEASAVED